jgi:hypothetical protein
MLLESSGRASSSFGGDFSGQHVPVDVCRDAGILKDSQQDLAIGIACEGSDAGKE